MIEWIMIFGLGFMSNCVVMLILIPQVHQRAVRLTIRRIRETEPAGIAELRADKDGQRAQFAVAVHRLEKTITRLREQLASQVTELAQNRTVIRDLKVELGRKTTSNLVLQAREQLRKSIIRRILSLLLFLHQRPGRGRGLSPIRFAVSKAG
jgi:hypothetical protein